MLCAEWKAASVSAPQASRVAGISCAHCHELTVLVPVVRICSRTWAALHATGATRLWRRRLITWTCITCHIAICMYRFSKRDVCDGRGSDVCDGSGTLIDSVVQAHFGCVFTFALPHTGAHAAQAHAALLERQSICVLGAPLHRTAPFETSVQTKRRHCAR